MKTYLLLPLSLALVACEGPNDVKGQLNLQRPTTIRTAGGNAHTLAPAAYRTQFKFDGQNNAQIFVQASQGSLGIKVPGLTANDQGKFQFSAAQLGQEFGVSGQIAIQTQKFDEIVNAYCVWNTSTECEWQDDGTCEWIEKNIEGRQQERQIGERKTKFVTIDLISRGKRIGQFKGNRYVGEVIHSREDIGGCEKLGW